MTFPTRVSSKRRVKRPRKHRPFIKDNYELVMSTSQSNLTSILVSYTPNRVDRTLQILKIK